MALVSTVRGIFDEVAVRLQEVSADESDTYLNWINAAMYDIAGRFDAPPYLETSAVLTNVASTNKWQLSSIASDIDKIVDVRISAENSRLMYLPVDQFNAMDPKPDDEGVPTVYTIFNDEIIFYPTPNGTYGTQVNYIKDVETVSAQSAVPEIPIKYLEGITYYCVIQGLYRREDFQQAQVMEAKYTALLERMKRDLKDKTKEMRRMVDIREIQGQNRIFSDEITRMFFNT